MKNLNILDVGCRYGIYDLFKNHIKDLNFHMVDLDKSEIRRLKTKYKNFKNIKFYNQCLGESNNYVNINYYNHKGYNSLFEINKKKNFWFTQKNERKIKKIKTKKIRQLKSSEFINRLKYTPDLIKVDIEGGELNFLVGLEKKINHIKCFIIESTYESNFNSEVNFGLIHNFMNKNNFSLIKIENQKNTKLNIFGNNKDNIPGVADFIYLNNRYLVPKNKNDYNLLLSLLLVVNHNHLLFYILEKYSKKFILSKKTNFLKS